MNMKEDSHGSSETPVPVQAKNAEQERIEHIFRQVMQDPGAQYLKAVIQSLHEDVSA